MQLRTEQLTYLTSIVTKPTRVRNKIIFYLDKIFIHMNAIRVHHKFNY